jgi:hypothetical protein
LLYHIWCGIIIIIIIIIITLSVFWQVHSPFRSEFSRDCYLMLTLSSSSIFSFPYRHPVAAYAFFRIISPSKKSYPAVSRNWKQLTPSRSFYTRLFVTYQQ